MNLLKRITSEKFLKFLPYIFFIVVHVFLFNVNVAEWGDSYRILRASEFIRNGGYPDDEKRPPLYSVILALRPVSVDPVIWSRILMFFIGLAGFYLFEKVLGQYIKNKKFIFLGMMFLLFNPDYLYWSIRVMADVPFALLALFSMYLFKKYRGSWTFWRLAGLGAVTGLAILTRFEGYVLAGSLMLALFLDEGKKIKPKNIRLYAEYAVGILIVVLPWILYRNPFSSKYLEEPGGREYDLKMLWIYFANALALYGFVPAYVFIFDRKKEVLSFFRANVHLVLYLVFELFLIMMWPAAIPRLFVAVIPVLILILVKALESWWEHGKENKTVWVMAAILLGLYLISQYFLKLQFLILDKTLFGLFLLAQPAALYFIYKKKTVPAWILLLLTMSVWSLNVIYAHKDIFISVKNAAEYASKNLSGKIAYNDVSSVSDFYLNVLDTPTVEGFYYNTESRKNLSKDTLLLTGADYLLITNEHNLSMELDFDSRPYLIPVKEFRYNVNGADFFAEILRINR